MQCSLQWKMCVAQCVVHKPLVLSPQSRKTRYDYNNIGMLLNNDNWIQSRRIRNGSSPALWLRNIANYLELLWLLVNEWYEFRRIHLRFRHVELTERSKQALIATNPAPLFTPPCTHIFFHCWENGMKTLLTMRRERRRSEGRSRRREDIVRVEVRRKCRVARMDIMARCIYKTHAEVSTIY